MALEQLRASSTKSIIFNLSFLLILLMCFICCCVAFGASQISGKFGSTNVDLYWDHVHTDSGANIDYDKTSCGKCPSGGKAYLAFMVLSFVVIVGNSVLHIARLFGNSLGGDSSFVIMAQLAATAITTFFYFLAICIFGGTIVDWARNDSGMSSIMGTGYAYTVFCFFALIAACVLIFLIRADPACHLTNNHTANNTQNQGAANPQAAPDVVPQPYVYTPNAPPPPNGQFTDIQSAGVSGEPELQ